MPSEVISIPVDPPLQHLGAAAYLAVLAYPKPTQLPRRDQLIDAFKAWMVKRAIQAGHKRSIFRADLRATRWRDIDGEFSKASRLITSRRGVARNIALPSLIRGGLWDVRIGEKSATINRALTRTFDSATGAKNAYRRVWSESKPVLHLAFGLENALGDYLPKSKNEGLPELLSNPVWLQAAIKNAEGVRHALVLMPQIRIHDRDTIQLIPESSKPAKN